MGKIANFLEKHGFSHKSYWIAFILFAPACFIIAWKIPELSVTKRVVLTLLAPIPLLIPVIAGTYIVQWVNTII